MAKQVGKVFSIKKRYFFSMNTIFKGKGGFIWIVYGVEGGHLPQIYRTCTLQNVLSTSNEEI